MRFIITGEWSRNTLLRVIVLFFLFYCFAFWLTNFGLYMEMGSFVTLQLSIIITIGLAVWSVASSQRNAYSDSAQRSRPS